MTSRTPASTVPSHPRRRREEIPGARWRSGGSRAPREPHNDLWRGGSDSHDADIQPNHPIPARRRRGPADRSPGSARYPAIPIVRVCRQWEWWRTHRAAARSPLRHRARYLELLQDRRGSKHPSAAGQHRSGQHARRLHLSCQHRRLSLGRGGCERSQADQQAGGSRPHRRHADRGRHAQARPWVPLPVVRHHNRAQTPCNVNTAIAGNQPTGQMYGGYYVGLPVDQGTNWEHYYHNGAFYSDPRISAYVGMGLHQMPGDVWWRSWRVLPPQQCSTDPDFSWQGQWPVGGYWQVYTDPQSGKQFNVWEGHYTYPTTNLTFIPTYGGGMFEGLMANEVVPETKWGPNSFGIADLRWAQVQVKYATEQLGYPVWGLSPSSTADDTGGYGGFGVEGLVWPYSAEQGLSPCYGCASETTVTPHASFLALDVLPQQAYANIQALRTLYPDIHDANGGFFDAVNPTTGAVGHRRLVLDQSMIMAALDNALNHDAMQQHFASDPVSWAARLYLGYETMSIVQ